MSDLDDLSHESRTIGALPIMKHFFDRLDLERLLETYVPENPLGRRPKVTHARILMVMLQNILLTRLPLYAVSEWVEKHVDELFGLDQTQVKLLNDDRIGRALDRLYGTDPASLMTAVVTRMVREFDIDLGQIHNDTTTVTFSGAYEGQKDKDALKRPPLITFGHNKDHRPDLKQLVYCLTISSDGAVPVHFKTYDGNKTDDKTHIDTWCMVRDLAGRADFIYVADSKLCTRENMGFISGEGGRFVTVLPRSRKEDDDFREQHQKTPAAFEEVRREKNPRGKKKPDLVYSAFEPKERSLEGYRIIWYLSSVKAELDEKHRQRRIKRARERVRHLQERTGAHAFRSVEAAETKVNAVLAAEGASQWLKVSVQEVGVSDLKQVGPGRPGKDTLYKRVEIPVILIEVEEDGEAIRADARCDGLFAMVTTCEEESPREVLDIYKYQPFLEKRNEQLKSVLSVAPVFLKRPERVAALLFLYFLAMLVFALVEREVRKSMKQQGIDSLPLYPEARMCRAPTTNVIIDVVYGFRRSNLIDGEGEVVKTFHDELSETAEVVLNMLGVDLKAYGREAQA